MNNQNESPFSNPKFLLAILITFLGLWGWQYYITKNYPQPVAPSSSPATVPTEKLKENIVAEAPSNKITNSLNVVTKSDIEEKKYLYEDEVVSWSISSLGMGLGSYQLKKYDDRKKQPIIFSSTQNNLFSLSYKGQPIRFVVSQKSPGHYTGEGNVDGKKVFREIIFNSQTKSFTSKTEFDAGIEQLSINFEDIKHRQESANFLVPSFERQDFLFHSSDGVKTENIFSHKDGEVFEKTISGTNLSSIGSQYFTLALVDKSEVLPSSKLKIQNGLASVDLSYNLQVTNITAISQVYYIGPKSTSLLTPIDPLMTEVMDYGIFGFISRPLLSLMKFLYGILGNWGLAIITLTLIVRLLLLPFNIMSFRSSRAMMRIQPMLKSVRERYKNDPMRVNKETMAIMKEHKANPLSGCLPMLIQIPIFFALWRTIGSSIEIYQQPFFAWIKDLSAYDPFFVLPILMGITMYFQQKLTPTTMDPMQAKILNFMPIIFTIFMVSLPSGLTLYNFVSALFGVAQQYFLLKDKSVKQVQVTT